MRRHVARCAACAEFERRLDALTSEIRREPLQRPARAPMLERRRRTGRRALQVCAAVAAVAAALGSLAGSLASPGLTTERTAPVIRVASLSTGATVRPGTRLQPPIAV